MVRSRFVLGCLLLCLAAAPPPVPGAGDAAPTITSLDVAAGNIVGVDTVTLAVTGVTEENLLGVSFGGQDAVVLSLVHGALAVQVPAVPEPTGQAVDVTVLTAGGSAVLPAAFLYTPAITASVIGSAAAGGGLVVDWVTAPQKPGQLVVVWVGNPALPTFSKTLPAYAGLIHVSPDFNLIATTEENHPAVLHFGPLPPAIAGLPLLLQGFARMEGGHKGTFTNVAGFAVP